MSQQEPVQQNTPSSPQSAQWSEGGQKLKSSEEFGARRLDTPLDRLTRRTAGRRSQTRTDRTRGRYIKAQPITDRPRDIAFDATIRAAAPHQIDREAEKNERNVAYAIQRQDLHRKIRVKKTANLIMFVVDASWSMAAAERMTATKGAIMSLLTDAYQRRDRVGLIVFQKDRATLVLPPTNSVTLGQTSIGRYSCWWQNPIVSRFGARIRDYPPRTSAPPRCNAVDDAVDRWCRKRVNWQSAHRKLRPIALQRCLNNTIFAP